MSPSVLALLGYAAWTLVLVSAIGVLRGGLTLSGARKSNSFGPTGSDVSAFSERLCRAHANCYEFFPVFGGVLGVAALSSSTHITDPLALWVLLARLGQSSVHIASTSVNAVNVRFAFFLVQVAVALYWTVRLAMVALA